MMRSSYMCPIIPYPTLFRSADRRRLWRLFGEGQHQQDQAEVREQRADRQQAVDEPLTQYDAEVEDAVPHHGVRHRDRKRRSEEHTSELQSRRDIVCRLLLEK